MNIRRVMQKFRATPPDKFDEMKKELDEAFSNPADDCWLTKVRWTDWYKKSFVTRVVASDDALKGLISDANFEALVLKTRDEDSEEEEERAASSNSESEGEEVDDRTWRLRKGTQRTAYAVFLHRSRRDNLGRFRKRMTRWELQGSTMTLFADGARLGTAATPVK